MTGDATYKATFTASKNSYTITWTNDDDSVIDTTTVEYGAVPTHADATKAATAEYTYTFAGWTPVLAAVTGNATYKATFTATKNSYTITWQNDDGSIIDTTTVEYGTVPTHADATKAATSEYTYTFAGWTPVLAAVTGNATYKATFTATKNSYTITWQNDDGSIIDTTTVEYGTVPTHADATKAATAEYTYSFAGWTPVLAAVTGDATYKATFTATKNSYTITWLNDDDSVIDTTTVEYGTVPTHADATKAATEEFTYTFAGWTPTVVAVEGNATYKATYTESKRSYTITWKNDDDSVIDTTTVEYGEVPTHADATKAATAQYTYTFTGWTPAVVAVTGDATYTAVYNSTVNRYTVTFVDEDGTTVLKEATEYPYGTAAEDIVKPADPTKTATAQYTFTFAGWSPAIAEVTSDVVYTATYNSTVNNYTITWKNDDNSVIDTTTVPYGEVPSHADATKAETAEYTYTFARWTPQPIAVTGEATYTATYTSVPKQYTITFKDGDETIATITQGFGTAVTAPEDPTKAHFEFDGWSQDVPETMPAENLTITALWNALTEYYLVGTINDEDQWNNIIDGYLFTRNQDAQGEEYTLVVTLHTGDEFKVRRVTGGVLGTYDNDWFPQANNSNYVVDEAHSGEVTIYFRPNGDGGDDWHYRVIYVSTAPQTNTFTHSDNLAHTDTYLYRVGNGNTVALGTLFKVDGSGTPDAANVKIKVVAVENNSSVKGSGTGLEDGSTAKCAYTINTSDWTQSTLKFTGEGPVKVEIWEDDGEHYTLNLEVVTGNNFVENATLNGNANIVLLGNVKVGASSGTNAALSLNNKHLYGNGFEIDATGSNISTNGHGIIQLINSSIDNVVILGPTFTSYQGNYNNQYYGSTVLTDGNGTSTITNCRITGASSPLRVRSDTIVKNTILSGGLLCNMAIWSGRVTVEDLTTISTQNSLGIVFVNDCSASSSITINNALTQHNFIADNATMSNTIARALQSTMFNSTYGKYQFVVGNRKYVNTGIVSMSSNIGADAIIDNRENKQNYSGMIASLLGENGYVYTMENTDASLLETSYNEPIYTPSMQEPYEPVFTWTVPNEDNVAAGGDTHCYQDSYGVLQIQFLSGSSKTINVNAYPQFIKYGGITAIPITHTSCLKQDGTPVAINGTNLTFAEAGNYTITFTFENVSVYDEQLNTNQMVTYVKTILVTVAVKQAAPDAVISCTNNTGIMIWGIAGKNSDKDYRPAARIFDNISITDYDDTGNPYTVLDGTNQVDFLNNIQSVIADSDNKTGFTINLKDGTKIVVKCGAPYNNGTLQFKRYDNRFLMCGSVAYNNPTEATWSVNSYTYTGRNGVAVSYTTKCNFKSTTDGTSYAITDLDGTNPSQYESCLITGTMITLADGTQKPVEELTGEERLLVWNLETGGYDSAEIFCIDHKDLPEQEYQVDKIMFSDGSFVEIVGEQGFFDLNLAKYVYIDHNNYTEYLGHSFVKIGIGSDYETVTLIGVETYRKTTKIYSPVTYQHFVQYANGILTMPGEISGYFNYFEVDTDTLKFNEEKKAQDIETYGLVSYEEYGLIPEYTFYAFNTQYVKIALGKGLLDWEENLRRIEHYMQFVH